MNFSLMALLISFESGISMLNKLTNIIIKCFQVIHNVTTLNNLNVSILTH